MKLDPILVRSLWLIAAGLTIMAIGVVIETPVLVIEVIRDTVRGRRD